MSERISVDERLPEDCTCAKDKGIDFYQYAKTESHMGFTDCDLYEFKPSYCPFCGKKLSTTD